MKLSPVNRTEKLIWVSVVLLAVVLRAADFPQRYVERDFDEQAYVQGGLALWEGITPTFDRTPAGVQTWISWLYAAGSTGRHLLFPGAEERAAPWVLRPFVAANHALFDIYRDWSILHWIEVFAGGMVAVAGVAAALALGKKRGGWMPALLLGGVTAALPLFVAFSGQAQSYAMAWGFAFIALAFAAYAADRPKAWRWSAIFMGLAITSRVDMLLLLPLAWSDLLFMEPTRGKKLARICKYTVLAGLVSYLVSPWLLTDLIGNLRAIVSVRLATPAGSEVSLGATLQDLLLHQGLGIELILVFCAALWASPQYHKRHWLTAVYVLLLSASILKGTGFGLRHQGAPIVALTAFAAVGLAAMCQRRPRLAAVMVILALAVPFVQSIGDVIRQRRLDVPYHATDWIERHVPAGVCVYLSPNIHDPLPTVAASNAIWAQVTEGNSWTKKLDTAMARFHSQSASYPRAFSQANMVVERGIRRGWFILGSRAFIPDPRYDIHLFRESVVFSVKDASAEFHRTGGVLICNDAKGPAPSGLGRPIVQWLNADGQGVRIYCSPDMVRRLSDPGNLPSW